MFPGRGNANENAYVDIIVRGLHDAGVDVKPWVKELPMQTGDIFHIHWPEVITMLCVIKGQRLRASIVRANFFNTIRRIKASGGKVVWTVHDLEPHSTAIKHSEHWIALRDQFLPLVDGFISLTASGVQSIEAKISQATSRNIRIARHPHYRQFFLEHIARMGGPKALRQEVRNSLGIPTDGKIIGLLGNLRPNKGIVTLINQFLTLKDEGVYLILGGAIDVKFRSELEEIIGSHPRIVSIFRRVPNDEFLKLHSALDLVILPEENYFNSGTVYTALSLGVPALVSDTSVNRELQLLVGEDFLRLITNRDDWGLSRVLEFGQFDPARQPKLDNFDPSHVAQQHLAAYNFFLNDGK